MVIYSNITFTFHSGATYYSDISSQGTKWIVDWYGRAGLQITNVVAWEKKPMMGDLAIRGIPDHLVHGYQFLNHPIHRYLHYAMRVRYIFYMCGISYLVIIHCMHAGMYVCIIYACCVCMYVCSYILATQKFILHSAITVSISIYTNLCMYE